MALKTDYKNFIPPEDGRKYQILANVDGSSQINDITQYVQAGDTFGAADINATNAAVNALDEKSNSFYSLTADAEDIPSSTSIGSITTPGFYTGSGNTSGPEGGQFLLIVETHGTYGGRQLLAELGEADQRRGAVCGGRRHKQRLGLPQMERRQDRILVIGLYHGRRSTNRV